MLFTDEVEPEHMQQTWMGLEMMLLIHHLLISRKDIQDHTHPVSSWCVFEYISMCINYYQLSSSTCLHPKYWLFLFHCFRHWQPNWAGSEHGTWHFFGSSFVDVPSELSWVVVCTLCTRTRSSFDKNHLLNIMRILRQGRCFFLFVNLLLTLEETAIIGSTAV